MKKFTLAVGSLAIIILCVVCSPRLLGWGAHRFHADTVRKFAAPQLKTSDGKDVFAAREWDEYVELYTYYPDYGGAGDAVDKRADALWEYYVTSAVKHRAGGSHGLRATVQYFRLMLDAFAAGDTRKAALWSGCLTHVIGDAAAANHPPLLMYLTYAYGPMEMTIGDSKETVGKHGKLLDVAGPCEDELGRRFIEEALKNYKPAMLADNAEDAAVRLQAILVENWRVALEEEAGIAAGLEEWVGAKEARGREALQRGMARLVVKCTRDAADAIHTAQRLAEKKQTFDVDRAIEKARPHLARAKKEITLAQVSAYRGLPRERGDAPAVAVFLAPPPIYWVTGGPVDLQYVYFVSVIARTLAEEKIPVVAFDVRQPPASLDPKRMPLVILPPVRSDDGFSADRFEKMLADYRKAGGKVLLVGGHPTASVGPLAGQLTPCRKTAPFYPLDSKEMPGKTLSLLNANGKNAGAVIPIVKIAHDFDIRGNGAYVLKGDAPKDLRPVLLLDTGESKLPIAAGQVEGEVFRTIYAPWYLFLPGSFSEEKSLKHLDRPTLDAAGRKMLRHFFTVMDVKL